MKMHTMKKHNGAVMVVSLLLVIGGLAMMMVNVPSGAAAPYHSFETDGATLGTWGWGVLAIGVIGFIYAWRHRRV